MEVAGIRVEGLSVGGMETSIDLPDWKLAIDVGRCPDGTLARPTVLFTHGHMDHLGNVAWHAGMRALRGMPPPTYVVPHEYVEDFAELFRVWRRIDRSDLPHRMVALGPGEEHAVQRGLVARPFRSVHRAPCQGYGLWSRREKLLPEYAGLSSEEVGRLRTREGVRVTEVQERCELAFTGDTSIEVVEREEVVRTARVLVIECTFLDERVSPEGARESGHVHLDDLARHADALENEAIVLTHFSSRYTDKQVRELLAARLPGPLRGRVRPLLRA